MSPKDIEADFRERARDDVVSFKLLKLDGACVALTLLPELVKGPANGIRKAVNDKTIFLDRERSLL